MRKTTSKSRSRIRHGGNDRSGLDEDAQSVRYGYGWGRRLEGRSKTIASWTLGLFLMTVGAGIVVAYETYWARVVKPEIQGTATAISVSGDKVDPQNEGKLVHVVGMLTGAEKLSDPEFGVAVEAMKLRRRVWMRQWEQGDERSKSRTSIEDRNTHQVTTLWTSRTYDYSEVWSENVIDSHSFYNPGHDNPPQKKIPDRQVAVPTMSLGDFTVSPELAGQLDNFEVNPATDKNLGTLSDPLRAEAKIVGGEIYVGADPGKPAIGDLRVRFESAPATTVSVIARQNGSELAPFLLAKRGAIALLRTGSLSVGEMTAQLADQNSGSRKVVWGFGVFVFLFGLIVLRVRKR